MSDLVTRLKEVRVAAAMSQAALAQQVGVSRQALSGIESGRQVPSTLLALQLARALGCQVEDLFQLRANHVVEARTCDQVRAQSRVMLARINGQLVAHRQSDTSRSADGVVLSADNTLAQIELVAESAAIENNIIVAGCAPLLGVLAQRLGRRFRDVRASWLPANSTESLHLLGQGLTHLSGVHLAHQDDVDAHIRAARARFPGENVVLVNLAQWRQGFVLRAGNALSIKEGSDLLRTDVRVVQREDGAGAQEVLRTQLRGHALARSITASSHRDVAQLVRAGVADVGVAIESVALAEGLEFIPLTQERFDLVLPESRLSSPAVVRFLELIDQPMFRAEAASLPGYDLSLAGHANTITPSEEAP